MEFCLVRICVFQPHGVLYKDCVYGLCIALKVKYLISANQVSVHEYTYAEVLSTYKVNSKMEWDLVHITGEGLNLVLKMFICVASWLTASLLFLSMNLSL